MKNLKSIFLTSSLLISSITLMAQDYTLNANSLNAISGVKSFNRAKEANLHFGNEIDLPDINKEISMVSYKNLKGYNKTKPFLEKVKLDPKPATNITGLGSNSDSKQITNPCFNENTRLLNLGIGVGGYHQTYYNGRYSSLPAFSVSYEQARKEKIGPGYLGVGGYFGFKRETYLYESSYDNYYYKEKYGYYIFAARAAYHWDPLNSDDWELYGGVLLGFDIVNYKFETNYDYYRNHNYGRSGGVVGLRYSGFAGGRYYFKKNLAAFCELGYGISYANFGITFKR